MQQLHVLGRLVVGTMTDLSPAAAAVLSEMRRSYDHEPTRCAMAADMLWALSQYLPIQELTREVPDEFEQGMAQGQHLSKAWLEMVSEELRAAGLAASTTTEENE
jgi:hypothetical protein